MEPSQPSLAKLTAPSLFLTQIIKHPINAIITRKINVLVIGLPVNSGLLEKVCNLFILQRGIISIGALKIVE